MKHIPQLKGLLAISLITLLLAATYTFTIAQDNRSSDLKPFKIILEKTENGIALKSLMGCAWNSLSFSIGYDEIQAIDEYGLTKLTDASPAKDSTVAHFLFTITKTNDGIILNGIEGTTWTELSFTLLQNEKQAIDQFDMTE